VKCIENLSNRVSNITRRYTDHMRSAAFMVFSFVIFLRVRLVPFYYHCVYGCMLLFDSVSYVFLLLCVLSSVYSVFIVPAGTLRLL